MNEQSGRDQFPIREVPGIDDASQRVPDDMRVVVIVEAPLQLFEIAIHMLDAVVVVVANPSPLDQSPESLDAVRVPVCVRLARTGRGQLLDEGQRAIDHGVKHLAGYLPINRILVGYEDRSVFLDKAVNEPFQAVRSEIAG